MGRMSFVPHRLLLIPVAFGVTVVVFLMVHLIVLTVIISVPLAMLAASRKDGLPDHLVRAVPVLGLGMPAFWVGLMLQYGFAISLKAFPVTGFGSGVVGHLRAMFLPALTVTVGLCPVVIRALRASMLEVLTADYITTARSKGVTGVRLLGIHVLRNVAWLIGTTLITEEVFALPGIGQLMVQAIFQRDFPVVQGVTLVFGVLVVLINLLTDVGYALLDPRVRFSR
jgi:peptide/nickel transport system permease protein